MSKWLNYISRLYLKIVNSIAFWPSLLAIAFLIRSLIIIRIEFTEPIMFLKENINDALVHSSENARLVLGTIVGSIISLMVFSFSMVMVVLNRATATLSPRVLPGLISSRFHQVVLGVYIGTIIYSLIIIINIDSPDIEYSVPSFGVFLSMIMAIICLGLFVYFIHSISQKIQVDNILGAISSNTSRAIKAADSDEEKPEIPETKDWYQYGADFSGYLKKIHQERLKDFCEENELKLIMKESIGAYIIKYYPFILCNKELNDEQLERLISCFMMYDEEHVKDHYQFGFNQISEIAIKALSPGINDPGTAIRAIDLLADLFIQLMFIKEQKTISTDNENAAIYLKPMSFKEVLYKTLVPIRKYGNGDVLVVMRLLRSLQQMLYAHQDEILFMDEIHSLIENIVDCSKELYQNELDKEAINHIIKRINHRFSEDKAIELI
jgi:uncharacterized membrane protein